MRCDVASTYAALERAERARNAARARGTGWGAEERLQERRVERLGERLRQMLGAPREGQRVRLRLSLERFQTHGPIEPGMAGTVVLSDGALVAVRLDAMLAGLEPWDNEVHWSNGDERRFWLDCEPTPPASLSEGAGSSGGVAPAT